MGASSKRNSWTGLLTKHVKTIDVTAQVTNLAKPRFTSYHILPTGFKTHLEKYRPNPEPSNNITKAIKLKPDLIIINLPSNDIAYNYSLREQLKNFLTILKVTDIPILITTSQPRNSTERVRNNLKQLADSIHANFLSIDFWDGLATEENRIKPEYDSGDGIHLNDKGHRLLFKRIIQNKAISRLNKSFNH